MSAGREFLGRAIDVEFVSAEGAREVVSGTSGITLRATSALDPPGRTSATPPPPPDHRPADESSMMSTLTATWHVRGKTPVGAFDAGADA
jgi:hypothetical protein